MFRTYLCLRTLVGMEPALHASPPLYERHPCAPRTPEGSRWLTPVQGSLGELLALRLNVGLLIGLLEVFSLQFSASFSS